MRMRSSPPSESWEGSCNRDLSAWHSSVLSAVFMSLLSPVFQIHHFSEAFFIKEHSWEELQNSADQLYVFVLLVLHVL